MIAVEYTPVDFPQSFKANLTKPGILTCSWADIVRSAVTVGRRDWLHVLQHGQYSYFEMIYRSAFIYANLRQITTFSLELGTLYNFLLQSSAYENLDPSEKSAISYFLGLTTSKLFAEKMLGVAWLIHLDVYEDKFQLKLKSEHRPDLIGLDKEARWIVIEAKGRSNNLDKQVMKKAKRQAQSLAKISGSKPFLYVALASYFSSLNNALKVYVKDPPLSEDGLEVDIPLNDYLLDYYEPIIEILEADHNQLETILLEGKRYSIRKINEIDISIGLDQEVYSFLSDARFYQDEIFPTLYHILRGHSADEQTQARVRAVDQEHISVGLDGIYIQVGQRWNNKEMALEPKERSYYER